MFHSNALGKLKGGQVSLKVQDDVPVFVKARTVPFAIHERFDQALDKLEKDDVIEKVQHSEWASPTVPDIKSDGELRIYGDYSGTINKYSQLEQYPVSSQEELLNKLGGGRKYSKLDLSQAYHQLELSPGSWKYTMVNTHQGMYQY